MFNQKRKNQKSNDLTIVAKPYLDQKVTKILISHLGAKHKKMKAIEIKVENKGFAKGTLGWFNEILSRSELIIRETKTGTPAMWLKTKKLNSEDFDFEIICKAFLEYSETEGYRMDGNIAYVYAENRSCNFEVGFSDYALTPACKKAVEELINKAVVEFSTWFAEN